MTANDIAMPEYLIQYCPELGIWTLTDCSTWKRKIVENLDRFDGPLLAVFQAATANPDKIQGVKFSE